MRIIVDMDEVLVHTVQPWIDRYNTEYSDDLQFSSVTCWYMHEFVKPIVYDEDNGNQVSGCGVKVYELIDEEGFFENLEPIHGAIEGMKSLIDQGHDVIIATASPTTSDTAHAEKVRWLKKHMPFFPLKNFMSISRKDTLNGDVMFDDAPHNLDKFSGISVAFKKPWNATEKDCWDLSVDGWKTFMLVIRDLSNKSSLRHLCSLAEQRLERVTSK